jgi:hypothetical protein
MYIGGMMCYFLFREGVDWEDNVFEWMDLRRPEAALGLICSFIAATCTLCYFCAYISRLTSTIVLGQDTTNRICIFVGVLASVFCFMFLMFIEDKIYYLVYALGDFCVIFLAFVLPGVYYLAQFRFMKLGLAAGAILLIVVGLVFAGLLLWMTVPDLNEVWTVA